MSAQAGPHRDSVGGHRVYRLRRHGHHPPLEGLHNHSRQVNGKNKSL